MFGTCFGLEVYYKSTLTRYFLYRKKEVHVNILIYLSACKYTGIVDLLHYLVFTKFTEKCPKQCIAKNK